MTVKQEYTESQNAYTQGHNTQIRKMKAFARNVMIKTFKYCEWLEKCPVNCYFFPKCHDFAINCQCIGYFLTIKKMKLKKRTLEVVE